MPSTKIPETIRRAQAISQKYNVIIATFGHVGDGNVHTTFVCDVRSRDDWNRLKPAAEELVKTCMEMKGTLSAEHGTGLTRAPHIEMQLGPAMEVMRKIKKAMDPDNILNPGKMGLEKGARRMMCMTTSLSSLSSITRKDSIPTAKTWTMRSWPASIADSAVSDAPPSA